MNLFEQAGLKKEILDAIKELGYENPTDIQKETIPFLLDLENDNDLIALAQTGTGKTAAFSLPIIEQIEIDSNFTQALILCPTRELCLQIAKDIEKYTVNLPKINSLAVYGGSSISEQIRALKKHPKIVIGTPGRMNDMIRRKTINLSKIQWVVLDEADEMLSMGFKEELETILSETPDVKQTMLFSATMSKPVEKIAKGYMNNPHKISVGSINSVKKNIEHLYCFTRYNEKLQVLHRILDSNPDNYTIIFCRTKIETQQVADFLMLQHFAADSLHGDLSQAQRDTVMKKFRLKNIKILVATDVAARGLDVNNLTHVIHFSLPDDPENFVHRSGRTGRAGKSGQSICLLKTEENRKLKRIEAECSIKIEPLQIPTNEVIIQAQINNVINQLSNETVINNDFTLKEFPDLSEITKEELFERFIYLHLQYTLEYYKKHPSIEYNIKDFKSKGYSNDDFSEGKRGRSRERNNDRDRGRDRGGDRERSNDRDRGARERGGEGKRKDGKPSKDHYTRFFLNLGRRDNFTKIKLMEMINRSTPGSRAEIGDIDVRDKFTFFEVDQEFTQKILKSFNNNSSFNQKEVRLEVAN